MDTVAISKSVAEGEPASIGSLHWEAFGRKLRAGFANESTGVAMVRAADLTWSHLRCQLSLRGSLRAIFALSPLPRAAHPGSLVLDGICVDSFARGFAPVGPGSLGPLSFGFDGYTTVELAVDR